MHLKRNNMNAVIRQFLILNRRSAIAAVFLTLTVCVAPHAQDLKKQFPESLTLDVTNPLEVERSDALVTIPADLIRRKAKSFNDKAFVVTINGREIASQYVRDDSAAEAIVVVLDKVAAKEKLTLTVRYNRNGQVTRNYTRRTQAELSHKTGGKFVNREYVGGAFRNVTSLRVPPEHKDHSWFIRYEGPGWESDKVGYRFYLDQRNATDVFGKKTADMILQWVGQDNFDSYHEMQPWGMDVMKVGKSLGVGSIGYLDNGIVSRVEKTDSVSCEIRENGNLYSSVLTRYNGWRVGDIKTDLISYISIHGGARHTRQQLLLTGNMKRICTGIVKDANARLHTSGGTASSFGYIATFGKQSLNNDNLGLAVLFSPSSFAGFSEDNFSHVVDMNVADGRLEYYFLAAWSGEIDGITDEATFLTYVQKIARELANPLKVQIR
jgi:hypothetical protein